MKSVLPPLSGHLFHTYYYMMSVILTMSLGKYYPHFIACSLIQGLLPAATKLGQGNVFTGICDSVHGGGVSASVPPRADTPQDQTPPPAYGQRAAGTHPTGMHSCFCISFTFLKGYGCHDYEIEMYCKHKKNDCDKPRWWEELKLNCAETCGWCAKTESEDPRVKSGMTLMA